MNGLGAWFEMEVISEQTAKRFLQGLCTSTIHLFCYWFWLLILICKLPESTAVYSYIHLIYRAACDWGIWDNWSNLVGTPWTESKMVTAGRNQDHQKALTDCTENCTRTLCGRKCDFFMGAGCKSHIPHKTSLQTTEGLGLEKYLFVNYTDIKKKKKALYNDCWVGVQSIYIVQSVLYFTSLLSTRYVHDKLNYSIDCNGLLQIYPGTPFRNFLLFCSWPPDFMGVFLLKGNEMENTYQHSHFVLLHHFTSSDIRADTKITLNSRKPRWQE